MTKFSEKSEKTLGTLYGVSLGPGDPGLITRRAWDVLQSDAHWAWPVRKSGSKSYALEIVQRAGLSAQGSELVFPMTHNPDVLIRAWSRAATTILPLLQQGKDVAFLVEGDASTYASFTYLARFVLQQDATIPIETIAGVSSYHAAAASVATPLAETDDTIAILPAGYGIDELDALLPHFDTLVLLKVKPVLPNLIDWLERRSLLTQAKLIERAGAVDERIVDDLSALKGESVNYLSLILLRNSQRSRGTVQRGCRPR